MLFSVHSRLIVLANNVPLVFVAIFEPHFVTFHVVHEAVARCVVQVLRPLVLAHVRKGLVVAHPEHERTVIVLQALQNIQNRPLNENMFLLLIFICF